MIKGFVYALATIMMAFCGIGIKVITTLFELVNLAVEFIIPLLERLEGGVVKKIDEWKAGMYKEFKMKQPVQRR